MILLESLVFRARGCYKQSRCPLIVSWPLCRPSSLRRLEHLVLDQQIIDCLASEDRARNARVFGKLLEQVEFLGVEINRFKCAFGFSHAGYAKLHVALASTKGWPCFPIWRPACVGRRMCRNERGRQSHGSGHRAALRPGRRRQAASARASSKRIEARDFPTWVFPGDQRRSDIRRFCFARFEISRESLGTALGIDHNCVGRIRRLLWCKAII